MEGGREARSYTRIPTSTTAWSESVGILARFAVLNENVFWVVHASFGFASRTQIIVEASAALETWALDRARVTPIANYTSVDGDGLPELQEGVVCSRGEACH